jgi:Pentapeptide repeats (8 copies)
MPDISIGLAIATTLAAVLYILWQLPRWQVGQRKSLEAKDELDLEIKARTALAQILGGIILIVGVYSTWKSFNLAREQQVTTRFTAAVEQLGHKKRSVRIGGLYALERIADDSPRDRPAVIQVLASYIRDQRPWQCDYAMHTICKKRREQLQFELGTPRAEIDVQAAVRALLAQTAKMTSHYAVDLSNCDLRGVDFSRADLRRFVFNKSYLGGAKFVGANMRGQHLVYVCIPEWAEFEDADLTNIHLVGAYSFGARRVEREVEKQKRISGT